MHAHETSIGFHASHEQIGPVALREAVVRAEQAGFDSAMCSDHLAPWSATQGESAFAFSWLGAALQATERLSIGQFHAPGQRYHPVISAQAAATLAAMFPGRYTWMALGSGELLNEHVTGQRWPRKEDRMARLRECVDVMRALWSGERVSHDGMVTVDRARLWTLPDQPIALLAGAISESTAAWAGEWADGLLTVNQDDLTLQRLAGAYRESGGRGPLGLQVHLVYDEDADRGVQTAVRQWRSNCLPNTLTWDLALPEQFEDATRFVPVEEVRRAVLVIDHPDRLVEQIERYVQLGYTSLYLHHVGVAQDAFIDMAAQHVLPQVAVRS
jgi:probable non-F420 flavinoid oxidoreductase